MPAVIDRREREALEVPPARSGNDGRPTAGGRRRRRGLPALAVLGALAVGGALYLNRGPSGTTLSIGHGQSVRVPSIGSLSPLRAKIVSIAESQIGYTTDPPGTYCNKYSAYWYSGADDCGNANLDEEWCADFAAWVWKEAGAAVNYQYVSGDLNSSAASFYEWGAARGTWHPLGSGYVPQPGDVAVYGLDTQDMVAAHVAIVIGYQPGDRGPTAVNGDGDLTAFSVVEVRTDEYLADTHPSGAPLSGYVSPSYISAS
ncbi:MAG TPA: CHAP domain-containing protein [Acidimicrobiales bacterium]|nr:CHAP domain-containing protein [Acidimicrobiales bacterium]